MDSPSYTRQGLLNLFFILPIIFQGVAFFVLLSSAMLNDVLAEELGKSVATKLSAFYGFSIFFGFLLFCGFRGMRFAEGFSVTHVHQSGAARYRPIIIAFAYTLLIALVAIYLPLPEEGAIFGRFSKLFGWAHFTTAFIVTIGYLFSSAPPYAYLLPPLAIYAAFGAGMGWGYHRVGVTRHDWLLGGALLVVFSGMIGGIAQRYVEVRSSVMQAPAIFPHMERKELQAYQPFGEGNRLKKVAAPTLQIAADHPKLDGSTALYPVYSAAVEAIYKGVEPMDVSGLVRSSKTPHAYRRLIKGEADLIMATPPSPEQLEEAKAAGVDLKLTPIAREAFVFFVQRDNPVQGLTTEQIRQIYQKEIVNWKDLGGVNRAILPFQRPVGSGSQTAFLGKVMAGQKPASPLQQERARGMGGMIREVASYQNSEKAIGYSFRYYLTTMDGNPDVKMLAIDGVEPSRETIRSGRYPYSTDLCLVSVEGKNPQNPHIQALTDWFLSPQGQALVEEVGYVGVAR